MVSDQIADLLTRIRNAQRAGHPAVSSPASKSKKMILELLEREGYIAGFEEEKLGAKSFFKVRLRYDEYGGPVIKELKRISRPGRRRYVGKDDIPKNHGGLGLVVVSTSKGVLSDQQARLEGIGGELVCSVF